MSLAASPGDRRVELALAAHARGWALTPLHGKQAYLDGWQKRPPPSRDDVVAWATAGNVGIRTGRVSGVLIVDVDVHRGGVIPAWAEAAPRVRTGRGGAHCYFVWPAEPVPNFRTEAPMRRKRRSLRGTPPSRRPSGRPFGPRHLGSRSGRSVRSAPAWTAGPERARGAPTAASSWRRRA